MTKDVEDYALVAGIPARQIGRACRCGRPLHEPDTDGVNICPACSNEYRWENNTVVPIREHQGAPS